MPPHPTRNLILTHPQHALMCNYVMRDRVWVSLLAPLRAGCPPGQRRYNLMMVGEKA